MTKTDCVMTALIALAMVTSAVACVITVKRQRIRTAMYREYAPRHMGMARGRWRRAFMEWWNSPPDEDDWKWK